MDVVRDSQSTTFRDANELYRRILRRRPYRADDLVCFGVPTGSSNVGVGQAAESKISKIAHLGRLTLVMEGRVAATSRASRELATRRKFK